MTEESFSDRRKHPRTPLDLELEVSHVQSDDDDDESSISDIVRCKCRDISGGGISFYSMSSYPVHSVLRLHIPLEDTSIKVMGKVMWYKELPTNPSHVTGVQFLNIYEQDFNVLCSYIMTKCL